MKLIYKTLVFLGCLFASASIQAQDIAIIPYKVIANKMIIEVKLNGKLVPMIFDTGGKNAISSALKEEFKATVIDSKEIMDANSSTKHVDIVKLNQVETLDGKAAYKAVPFIVVDNDLFTCLGVGGLIASDLWQNNTIEINDQKKEIRVKAGGTEFLKTNPNAIPFAANVGGAPIFNVKVGKHDEAQVLFDSGAESFLSIRSKDFPRLEGQGALYMIRQGKGTGSGGVIGRRTGIGKRILLEIPELIIGGSSFGKFRANVAGSSESLLGYGLLAYGNVTIDYVNKLFLFEPNKAGKIELNAELKKNWDIEISDIENQLAVATVWEQLEGEAEIGDVVTHVDGKEIKSYSFCERLNTGLPVLNEKDQIVITVKTKQGTKNITIDKN